MQDKDGVNTVYRLQAKPVTIMIIVEVQRVLKCLTGGVFVGYNIYKVGKLYISSGVKEGLYEQQERS